MSWSEHLHPRDEEGKFTERKGGRKRLPKPTGGSLKAAQDARIRSATRGRVAADKAETERQRKVWAGRPHKH